MIETLLAFGMGVLMSQWVLGLLFIAVLILDFNEIKFMSGLLSVVILSGIYLIFKNSIPDVGWPTIVMIIAGYLTVGIGWSLFKFRRYVSKLLGKYEAGKDKDKTMFDYTQLQRSVSLTTENVERISYWAGFWPVSVVGFFLHDFLNWVVTDVLAKLYQHIADSVLKNATIVAEPEKKNG
jgi:hypothetical protein